MSSTRKLSEQEAADKIAALDTFLKAGVLSYDKYKEAVTAIEMRITDTFKAELHERARSRSIRPWILSANAASALRILYRECSQNRSTM